MIRSRASELMDSPRRYTILVADRDCRLEFNAKESSALLGLSLEGNSFRIGLAKSLEHRLDVADVLA